MFSERLKEVREAKGLSQQAMAAQLGVSLRSQQNYEAGIRSPDATYLSALATLGMDVLYVLTGQRTATEPALKNPAASLSPRQAALLDNYQHTDEQGKKIIEAAAFAAAQSQDKKAARGGER